MSALEQILTILTVIAGTMFTRFISFVVFPEGKPVPSYIIRLGRLLPYSMMGLLVIYSIRHTLTYEVLFRGTHGLAEFISIIFIIFIQKWRKSMLFSILFGTALYMFLVQKVFVSGY